MKNQQQGRGKQERKQGKRDNPAQSKQNESIQPKEINALNQNQIHPHSTQSSNIQCSQITI